MRLAPGRGDAVREIEVLAALDGPVLRRVTGRPVVPTMQVTSLALAAVLVATTAAILLGRIWDGPNLRRAESATEPAGG